MIYIAFAVLDEVDSSASGLGLVVLAVSVYQGQACALEPSLRIKWKTELWIGRWLNQNVSNIDRWVA